MAIITLTSDWGQTDHYVAAVKGRLLSLMPDIRIVDISHNINLYDTGHAAFVVKYAFPSFPEGTIHIIGINSIADINTPHTVAKYHGHYFIGADNGIFSLICDHGAAEIVEVDIPSDTSIFTFPSRDLFPRVAEAILSGKKLSDIGTPKAGLRVMVQFAPIVTEERITGKIIHFDHYGNAITNIPESLFRSFVKGKPFEVSLKSQPEGISRISGFL
jgi:S-adenosyl-L-methionine hydrolase (adenosine-forming)